MGKDMLIVCIVRLVRRTMAKTSNVLVYRCCHRDLPITFCQRFLATVPMFPYRRIACASRSPRTGNALHVHVS